MTEKEYKLLLKKLKEDLKPVISSYIKKASRKYLKETLETLKDFNVLSESYTKQRLPDENKFMPKSYSNSKKMGTIQENLKVGNVDIPLRVKPPRPSDPSQIDYSDFMEELEKAENIIKGK